QADLYGIVMHYLATVGAEDALIDWYDGPYSFTLPDRSADLGTANSQGVAYAGTQSYYYTDSANLYKYTRNSETGVYSLVTSRGVTGDDPTPAKKQINGINYHNGYLWVGANNFDSSPHAGWIVQYDPSDLTWVATHEVGAHWCEGGA